MAKELQRITGDGSIKRYFDTDYIGSYSIDDGVEPVLTIDSVWYGELTLGGGKKENHVILKFREKHVEGVDEVKPLILNATNRKTLKKRFGDDSASTLENKQIQLYVDPKVRDPQDGGYTEGLRIRPFPPKVQGAPKCDDCSAEVTATEKMSVLQIVAYGQKKYGAVKCAACIIKRQEADKAAQQPTGTTPAETAQDAPAEAQEGVTNE